MGAIGPAARDIPGGVRAAEERGDAVACPNCGATLVGEFCQACGQQRRDREDLTARRVVADAAREFVDLESGALATLRDLLLRPGHLTAEYLAGRRRAHVAPAKLYVLVSFVFFLFAWDRLAENAGYAAYFAPGGAFAPLLDRRGLDRGVIAERFNQGFAEYTTWLRFGSVLVSGLFMQLLYLGTRRLYAEHLVFSFHYFSFEFIISTLYALVLIGVAAATGAELPAWVSWLTYLIVAPYAFLALRRVYGESAPKTAAKTAAFLVGQFAIYLLVILIAMVAAFVLAVRSG